MDKLQSIEKELEKLKGYGYSIEALQESWYHQVVQLNYFYNLCERNNSQPDNTYYKLKQVPKKHQLAYFNIGRGFPKELMDGHWCYILKIVGCKAIVIPTTSLKKGTNDTYRKTIKSMDMQDKSTYLSSMSYSEIRAIDLQRLDVRKTFLDVITPRGEIITALKKFMFDEK